MTLLDLDETIASVTLIEDAVSGVITGSRLSVDPSASAIVSGVYPVQLVYGFSGDTSSSVEADLEISFLTLVSCLDAQISFPGSESFETEYIIYAGDWSIQQES